MADSSLPVTPGTGTDVDGRTESTNGNFRQVIVLGDPSVNDNVVSAVTADPGPTSTEPGIVTRMAGSVVVIPHTASVAQSDANLDTMRTPITSASAQIFYGVRPFVFNGTTWDRLRGDTTGLTVGSIASSVSTYLSGTAGTIRVKLDPESVLSGIQSSIAVHVGSTSGTITTKLDPSSVIAGIGSSVAIYLGSTAGTIRTKLDPESVISGIQSTVAIYVHSTSGTLRVAFGNEPTVIASVKDGTTTRSLRGNSDGAIKIYDIAQGTVTVSGITNSINAYIGGTAGTLGVRVGQVDGTVAVYFSPAKPVVLADAQHTSSIFTVSGSTSGGTTSGVTLVAPSASYNYKVFAYSLQTTGIVSSAWRFTNGAGSETEFWRPLVTAVETTSTPKGAVFGVQPPGFIFATGTNTTLALKSDSGSLVHYSVSYIKESA